LLVNMTLDLNTSKTLLEGPYGLFNALNMRVFANTFVSPNYTMIYDYWRLNPAQFEKFMVYTIRVTVDIARPMLAQIVTFQGGGGIVTARTAREWLFTGVDPLLEYLQPNNPRCAFVMNYTSQEQALMDPPSLQYTGKGSISKIASYKEWKGKSSINGVYAFGLNVSGVDDWGQFQPFLDYYTPLAAFDTNYIRPIPLVVVDHVEIKGISGHRYFIDNSTWDIDEFFLQSIQGFANMTGAQQAPIFVSNPHMSGASEKWRNEISGIREPNFADITYADVEPTTGKVINTCKMLQANAYVPQDSIQFNWFNLNMKKGLFFPLFWASETVTISKELAKLLNEAVSLPKYLAKYSLPTMLPLGIGLLIVGIWYTRKVYKSQRKSQYYTRINND